MLVFYLWTICHCWIASYFICCGTNKDIYLSIVCSSVFLFQKSVQKKLRTCLPSTRTNTVEKPICVRGNTLASAKDTLKGRSACIRASKASSLINTLSSIRMTFHNTFYILVKAYFYSSTKVLRISTKPRFC